MSEDRKLLEPMATVVSIALRILLGLLTVGVVFNVVRGSWGNGIVCAIDDSAVSSTAPGGFSPEPGANVASVPQYCAEDPGTPLRFLDELGALPSMLLLISSLFLLHRLLQAAARDGVYTAHTASRLRLLGWWLLLGSLVAEVIEANAKAALLAELAKEADFTAGAWLTFWSFPYMAVLTGLGLLTFARITRAGTVMREDLEGVV
ncbi:DUF2975 domain-containing protein [Streptomyces viridochromogenes]|uniref:DUF2975 domain-containing protein n=1 Tax=Streptomyces viridochromogenes Tue57 TaxID=1160705 RepID=L8P7X6_STRVR|nr:DUF2975 domain-containing protein [Streptomyces viridochromogenes]ELS53681.1 hypothetical protein STVIR_5358 [Streptomyces viridochromogenes Tue57]